MNQNKALKQVLPFFEPHEMPKYPFIFVCSALLAGQSTLIRLLVANYLWEQHDFVIGICGNYHTAQDYIRSGVIPEKYCHGAYRQEILKDWFEKCDSLLRKGKKLPSTLFIIDDSLITHAIKGENRPTRSEPSLATRAISGRHYRAAVILIVPSWGVSGGMSYVRNSDVVIVSPSSLYAGADFENLYKLYMTGTNAKQNKELLELFGRYDFLVLRYYKTTRDQSKLLAWYRVPRDDLTQL